MNKIEYINAALLSLARNEIGGLTDNSAEARVASAVYDIAYSHALAGEGVPWSFAKEDTAQLSKSATETAAEREVYPLPGTLVKLTKLFEGVTGREIAYEKVGNSVVVDEDIDTTYGLYARFVAKPNEGELPDYFEAFFVATLCFWFAMPLTQNKALRDSWEETMKSLRVGAAYADASGGGTKSIAQSDEYSMITGR